MQANTRINNRPSWFCASYLLIIHLLPICILWILFKGAWQFWTGLIICLISCGYYIFKYLLFLIPSAITQLWHQTDGSWLLLLKNGQLISTHLQGDSLITRVVIILNFKAIGRYKFYNVLVWPDSLAEATFRRLQVSLLADKVLKEKLILL